MENREAKAIIAKELDGELRPLGFKCRGGVFRRDLGEQVQVVSLQSSMYSTRGRLSITLNLGIFSVVLAEKLTAMGAVRGIAKEKVDASACHWTMRIGHLSEEMNDKWWVVTSERVASQAGREMVAIMKRAGLPKLESLSSTAALLTMWEARTGNATEETQDLYARALRVSPE